MSVKWAFAGRTQWSCHSNMLLTLACCDCRDALPSRLPEDVTSVSDAFFWQKTFDPETLQPLDN